MLPVWISVGDMITIVNEFDCMPFEIEGSPEGHVDVGVRATTAPYAQDDDSFVLAARFPEAQGLRLLLSKRS